MSPVISPSYVPVINVKGVKMQQANLDKLPKEKLIELAKMYARNWQTLDGLWFGNVEAEYGLEAAIKIDLQNWEKQAVVEAKRIKEVLQLNEGGLTSVLTVLSFMSWQLVSPIFEYEEQSSERIVFYYPHCSVQEGRRKNNKQEFPCKTMKLLLMSSIARIAEPKAVVRCIACPPDSHPDDFWCKWEITMKQDRT